MRRLMGIAALLILLSGGMIPARWVNARPSTPGSLPDESLLTDPVYARPGYADLALPFLHKTRYLLALSVDFPSAELTGQARILFVNSTPDPLDKVVLRLYPNHPWYSVHNGVFSPRAEISSTAVDGKLVTPTFGDTWQTVVNVPFAAPIPPGGGAIIDISYQLHAPAPGNILAELEPFPMLAVYENGAWREDVPTKGLDYVYSESALYAVHLHTSSGVAIVSTGAVKDKQETPDGVDYSIVTGPVRDFVFVVTKGWKEFDTVSIVPIRVYYDADAPAAHNIGNIAAAALRYYESAFGLYPYAKLDIIAMRYESGGEEYPTLIFCNTDGTIPYQEFITAHETAHQWFYGVAGDDIVRHAWLDESLAQISGYLFSKNEYGPTYAEEHYWPHILTWARGIVGTPRLIDTSLDGFRSSTEYMQTIYGAGAVFMRDLSDKISEQQFIAGLWEYYHAAFLAVGTPKQFFDSMQAQTPTDLAPLFCQRMGISCP